MSVDGLTVALEKGSLRKQPSSSWNTNQLPQASVQFEKRHCSLLGRLYTEASGSRSNDIGRGHVHLP
jgi:hypothetical protein